MRSQRVLIKMPSTGIRCADPRGGPRALSCAEQRARERDGEEGPCAGEACARPGPSYPRAALNLGPPGGPSIAVKVPMLRCSFAQSWLQFLKPACKRSSRPSNLFDYARMALGKYSRGPRAKLE